MMPSLRRPDMRRAVVILPNGFTLGNLFFGVWAIVAASQGDFSRAGWYVIFGGVMDALDGRVARMTRTGSRFGVELDSLVDAISFGVAPAMIMYFAVLNREGWAWLIVFIFVACAVMRLARFNVEQGGRAKTHFHGLPSPAAGMTLASYYWFSQHPIYTQTFIGYLPWHDVMRWIMLGLSFLMISHVLYPAMPNIGFRNLKGILGTLLILLVLVTLVLGRVELLFPLLMAYVVWGVLRTVFVGLLDRVPTGDPLFDADEDDVGAEDRVITLGEPVGAARHRKRRRRHRDPGRHSPFGRPVSDASGETGGVSGGSE
ncbi:MAG: CDP-diacylglycerol--serine O-phosphatidyltransferase [Gemmatimonadaceae bacterium]